MRSAWRSFAVLLIGGATVGCSAPTPGPGEPPVVPVRSEVVTPREFQASLRLLGVVRPSETFQLVVVHGGTIRYPASFSGGLRTGQRVRRGEELAVVENESVRLKLAEAQLHAELTAADLERIKTGYEAGILPETDLQRIDGDERLARERLESAHHDAARSTLHSPRSGTLIVEQPYPSGSELSAGTVIAEIAVAGRPRIEGWAAATDRQRLEPGLVVRVSRTADGSDPVSEGTLREIAPVVDRAGTIRVIADVNSSESLPPLGEGVEMQVQLALRDHVVTVPERALVVSGHGRAVFLLEPWGRAYKVKRVQVTTGDRSGDRVEILSGLEEGDRIAVAGLSLLDDGGLAADAAPAANEGDSAVASTESESEATGDANATGGADEVAAENDGNSP